MRLHCHVDCSNEDSRAEEYVAHSSIFSSRFLSFHSVGAASKARRHQLKSDGITEAVWYARRKQGVTFIGFVCHAYLYIQATSVSSLQGPRILKYKKLRAQCVLNYATFLDIRVSTVLDMNQRPRPSCSPSRRSHRLGIRAPRKGKDRIKSRISLEMTSLHRHRAEVEL